MKPPDGAGDLDSPPLKPQNKSFPKIKLSNAKVKRPRQRKFKKAKSRLVCYKCEEKFPTWWDIREHWISTGHKAPEQCRWCKRKTFTLQSHICKKHLDLTVMCPYCGQLFMFKEDREKHLLSHDGMTYRCFQCGRRKKNEEILQKHMFSHFINEKYGCNICEKRFKKKKNIERHVKMIHFICQYCGRTCESTSDLKDHVAIHDDLLCLLCNKTFSAKNRLKYHYQLKHGHQDFYRCTLCFQRFSMKGKLIEHLKLRHNGVFNYSCELCNVPFLYWQHYKNHLESSHVKAPKSKDFKCTFCGFTTDLKPKLRFHVEKSSGLGFFCKKCQIRLDCKGMFLKHMEIHKGEKIFTCDYCPNSYSSDDRLTHHITNQHREMVVSLKARGYPCLEPNCDRFYITSNSLARHCRQYHATNPNSATVTSGRTNVSKSLCVSIKKRKRSQRSRGCRKKVPLDSNIVVNCEKTQDNTEESADENINGKGYHHLMTPLPKVSEVDIYVCDICDKYWFTEVELFKKHMSKHDMRCWEDECPMCSLELESPEIAAKHYTEEHLQVEFVQCNS